MTDDSMASTVMISPDELARSAKPAENSATEPPPPAEQSEAVEAIDEMPPMPAILGNSSKTIDNIAASSTSEFNVHTHQSMTRSEPETPDENTEAASRLGDDTALMPKVEPI